jgi:hypothetical protein
MKKPLFFLLFLAVVFLFTENCFAKIGVGVNTGTIQVDERLKAGMIYKLPPITIINTGDEPSDYTTSVAYHQDQPELRPEKNWFLFTPKEFSLAPGEGQLIDININLPIKIEPGDYFAYLEGRPLATVERGKTTLGVAAAAKLYFTVVPANLIYAVYYKITTFFEIYAPWPQRTLAAILALGVLLLIKKFFNVRVNLKKPVRKNSSENQDE